MNDGLEPKKGYVRCWQSPKSTNEIASLGVQTRATDERLHALINVVERQISNGRNSNA